MKIASPSALFRVDAGAEIGMGHLSRCLNLARYLKHFGIQSTFLVSQSTLRYFPSHFSEFRFVSISDGSDEEADAEFFLSTAKDLTSKIGVVDNYNLGYRWQEIVSETGIFLVAIDDLERKCAASLLIDYNVRKDYDSAYLHSRASCGQLLLGPSYAILGEEFTLLRKSLPPWEHRSKRVHICFGGSDSKNITGMTLEACKVLSPLQTQFDVVVGEGYSHFEALRARFSSEPHYSIVQNPNNLPSRMADARLAIGAGGTMHWERCALGLPAIVISAADNQEPASRELDSLKIVRYLGHLERVPTDSVTNAVLELLQDEIQLYEMSLRAMSLVDGRGTKRVACSIVSSFLHLEAARSEDVERIFQWRNDPENLKHWSDSGELSRETHQEWFDEILRSGQQRLYVASLGGEAIGLLQLKAAPPEVWVSIYLAPEFHRSKLGLPLLMKVPMLLEEFPATFHCLRAEINHGNLASQSIFADAGYECIDQGQNATNSQWRKLLSPKKRK